MAVVVGAIAFAALLALSAVAQPSSAAGPSVPLAVSNEGADPASEPGTDVASGPAQAFSFAADISRIHRVRQPLTEYWVDGPYPATVIEPDAASPLGGPDPIPLDAPFGANVQIENAAGAQRTISIAAGTGQDLYAAYETPTAPVDVRVAKSTNGGSSWSVLNLNLPVTYNRRNPDVVFVAPSTVVVFIQHDDAAATDTYRYIVSTNAGATWATHTIGLTGFGFANLKLPGGGVCSTPGGCLGNGGVIAPNLLLVGYEGDCTRTNCAPAPGARQTIFVSDHTPGTAQDWFLELYSSGGTTGEGFRPQFAGSGVMMHGLIEFEYTDNAEWAVNLIQLDEANNTLVGVAIGPLSDDPIYGQVAARGRDVLFGGAYHNPTAFGTPNHLMQLMNSSTDGGSTGWNFIQGGTGAFEAASTEQKHLSLAAVGDVFHAAYRSASSIAYWISVDGSTWAGPYRPNDNAGTVVDVPHSVTVTYGSKVGLAWLDSRDGDDDPWFATLSGASMYVIKKNPASLGGTINIDAVDTPVPAAYIWTVGSLHPVLAPASEPGPPNTQYTFQSWSDGGANPHNINVGAADAVVTANYLTQYWLAMSATVGGVTLSPGNSWQNAGASVSIQCTMPPPTAYVRYAFAGWIGSGPGAYTGPANPTNIIMNGPITEVCDATREFLVSFYTQPAGLDLNVNGTLFSMPRAFWWQEGSINTVTAPITQGPPGPQRYVFDQWLEDGSGVPTKSLTITGPLNWTAVYLTEYQVTVTPIPADCDFVMDGTTYGSAQTFWYARDSVHLVDVPSPQSVGADTRYTFLSWSDGGAQNHPITVSVPLQLTLTCRVENRYVIDTNPSGTLTFTVDAGPAVTGPQTYWWVAGDSHAVNFPTPQALGPDSRRVFFQWSDGNTANPRTFTSGTTTTGAHTILTYLEHRWQFDTLPTGKGIVIDVGGTPVTAPGQIWLRDGTSVTITAPDPSLDLTDPTHIRYRWVSWSPIGGARSQLLTVTGPRTLIATYSTEFYLTVVSTYATTTGQGWYAEGSTANAVLSAGIVAGTPGTQYVFVSWTGDASGTVFSSSNAITMDAPKTATAQWKTQYQLTVNPNQAGATGTCSAASCWYDSGASATATVTPTTVGGPTDTRYRFTQWAGDATGTGGTSNPITMDAPRTATAQWVTQYYLTIVTPPAGVTASCSNADCWYDTGSLATVSMSTGGVESVPGQTRLGFIRWAGAATGTGWQASNPVTMDQPRMVDSEWQTQHKLTLVNDDPASTGTSTVSLTGSTDGWFIADTSAGLQVTQYATAASGDVRWEFDTWTGATGAGRSASVTMDGPKTVTLGWLRQVKVTVTTSPSLPEAQVTIDNVPVPADGVWVEEGASVPLRAPLEVTSGGKTYKFLGWTNATGGATTTIAPTDPTAIVARYEEASSPIVLIVALIGIIVAALLVALLFLMKRRKKDAEEAPPARAAPGTRPAAPPPPAAAGATTMECPSCGLTIEAGSTACPICGAEIAPPAPAPKDERIVKLEEAYKSGRINKEQYQANLKRMKGQA